MHQHQLEHSTQKHHGCVGDNIAGLESENSRVLFSSFEIDFRFPFMRLGSHRLLGKNLCQKGISNQRELN